MSRAQRAQAGAGAGARPSARETIARRLRFQAGACRQLGSRLYADLLERAAQDAEAGGPTLAVLAGHEADPGPSALALRLMGGVHRLVLEGRLPELAGFYRLGDPDPDEVWTAFRPALAGERERLRELVERPVQTNEVGRCAALLPGFIPMRVEFKLEGGKELPMRPVQVAERRGCDRAPVDPLSDEGRLTLLSYLWPDQPERARRLLAAIEEARLAPVAVERASAASWAREALREPVPGQMTVVFHSIVSQYLAADELAVFHGPAGATDASPAAGITAARCCSTSLAAGSKRLARSA